MVDDEVGDAATELAGVIDAERRRRGVAAEAEVCLAEEVGAGDAVPLSRVVQEGAGVAARLEVARARVDDLDVVGAAGVVLGGEVVDHYVARALDRDP